MSDLPRGWIGTSLGEICSKPQYGWTSKASKTGRIKYVRTTDISNGQLDWHAVPFCELEPDDIEKFRVRENDILVSRAGSVGVSFRIRDVPGDAVFASYLIRFNPLECMLPKYIEYFLRSGDYWDAISEFSAGIAIPNVNASKLAEIKVPVPPLSEQRRIVTKLEKLLSRVDTAQVRLATIPRILKRFRQSVLDAACSGRLTADWRDQNHGETKRRTNEDEPPSSWREYPLSKLVRVSSGEAFKKAEYSESGASLLQIANVSFGKIIWEQQNFLPGSYLQSHSDLVLNDGDIVMALNRPLLNWQIKVARVSKRDLPAILYQRVGRFSFVEQNGTLDSAFLFLFLQSPRFIYELSGRLRGTDQPYINPPDMLEILFPLAPLLEQREIVRRVEALFKTADALEARYRKAKAHVDKLTQSILAKAFRGELVPQNPNDEPAEKLLERVRSERENGAKRQSKTSKHRRH
ncbi:type I restriction-modification system specificity subunit [soil metagenome]